MKQKTLKMLIFQDGKFWLAHVIDLDIMAQGSNKQEALARCYYTMESTFTCDSQAETRFKPAPSEFFKMYDAAHHFVSTTRLYKLKNDEMLRVLYRVKESR